MRSKSIWGGGACARARRRRTFPPSSGNGASLSLRDQNPPRRRNFFGKSRRLLAPDLDTPTGGHGRGGGQWPRPEPGSFGSPGPGSYLAPLRYCGLSMPPLWARSPAPSAEGPLHCLQTWRSFSADKRGQKRSKKVKEGQVRRSGPSPDPPQDQGPTCSSSVKDTSARGGRGSSCNMGRNSLSWRSVGI